MLEFKTFACAVKNFIEKTYPNMDAIEQDMKQVNRSNYHGLILHDPLADISPVINLDEIYGRYLHAVNTISGDHKDIRALDKILIEMKDLIDQALSEKSEFSRDDIVNFEKQKHNIVFRLVNKNMLETTMKNIPYKVVIDDIVMIWAIIVQNNGNRIASVTITKELMEYLGTNERELEQLGFENTSRIFPLEMIDLYDAVSDVFSILKLLKIDDGFFGSNNHIMVTTKQQTNGACALLYKDTLTNLAEKFDDDVIIFPSRCHEVICAPSHMFSIEDAYLMMSKINWTTKSENENDLLSENVLIYQRYTGILSIL